MTRCGLALLAAALLIALLVGCGGEELLAYIGGSTPPGDGDVGGVVLAEAPVATAESVTTTQATTVPVVGAEVSLYRGQQLVGTAVTGTGGYFRFEDPPTGQFAVTVEPPAGSGLQQARRQFQHQGGQQTFLTIVLEPVNAD